MKKEIINFGDWDLEIANNLDNYAYYFYCKKCKRKYQSIKGYVMYTQTGFKGSVDCEEFYDKSKIYLRNKKIKKLKNL